MAGLVRNRELRHRLHAVGALAAARDVFYLELEERLGFVSGTATCHDLRALAKARGDAYASYRSAAAPADRLRRLSRWTLGFLLMFLDFQNGAINGGYALLADQPLARSCAWAIFEARAAHVFGERGSASSNLLNEWRSARYCLHCR
jgi:hypothetical protein